MSTKSTIAYGPDFHFYHEALDEDHVYLELETTHFEAGYGRVVLPIPIHIWETIRHLGGADLRLIDKTDDELRADVERKVDERIETYGETLREHPDRAGLVGLFGALVYGSADQTREHQIERGMAYHRARRQHQREIMAAIRRLREARE